jgi:predicted HD superfamily hydrolase involved in NAD metabolism
MVSIISDNLSIEVKNYCKKRGVKLIWDEFITIKNIVTPISSYYNLHIPKILDINNRDEILAIFSKYLHWNNKEGLYDHSVKVAEESARLCGKFNMDEHIGYISGLLHDIGGVFDNSRREEVADCLEIPLFKEERALPMIIHQKLSAYIAQVDFNISDRRIINAITCHTTLKDNYEKLDLILFVADKLEWDGLGIPPYFRGLNEIVNKGNLEEAALFYINY